MSIALAFIEKFKNGLLKTDGRFRMLNLQSTVFFISLFLLYSFRSLRDLTSPYLCYEDGPVLIQRAVYNGFSAIFIPENGFYWLLQQLLACFCYYILLPFGNLSILPQMMSFIVKLSATLSVLYFTSDRFEWVLSGKNARFITCAFIVLLLPPYALEVSACDTSMPFALYFAAFLIGLDLLCGKEAKLPNIKQTIFLSLLCLSHAGAVFIALFCGCAALRWFIRSIKENSLNIKELIIHAMKLLPIFTTSLIQSLTMLSSERASIELDLLNRLIAVTRSFVVFPSFEFATLNSLSRLAIIMVIGIIIILLSRTQIKIAVYCGVFSYLMLFLCSMTYTIELPSIPLASRYTFLSYEISTLLVCIILIKLYRAEGFKRHLSFLLTSTICVVSLQTYVYKVPVIGIEFAEYYRNYIEYFHAEGKEKMMLPVGPWKPWQLMLPVSISKSEAKHDLSVEANLSKFEHDDVFGVTWRITAFDSNGQAPVRLFVYYNETYHPAADIGGGVYQAYIYPCDIDSEFAADIIGETADKVLHLASYSLSHENLKELGVLE